MIRGTDKALQPRKFILIFRGDKAAVLSKVLNTSARCKNFCWHLRDLFSTTMILYKLLSGAGSWSPPARDTEHCEPGWAGGTRMDTQPGTFRLGLAFPTPVAVGTAESGVIFCFYRGGLFSQAGHSSRSVHAEHWGSSTRTWPIPPVIFLLRLHKAHQAETAVSQSSFFLGRKGCH